MREIAIRQITGTPSASSWSQVWEFIPKDEEKIQKRGNLVLLVCVEGQDQAEVSSLGREIISRFHEEYYGDLHYSIMDHLSTVLRKIGKEKPIFVKSSVKINLGALINWDDAAYLGAWGGISFILEREKKQGILLNGRKNEVKVISGPIMEKDLFLIASSQFLDAVPVGTINAALGSESPDNAFEMLSPIVHSREDQGLLAAVLVSVGAEKKEGDAEVVEESSVEPPSAQLPEIPQSPSSSLSPPASNAASAKSDLASAKSDLASPLPPKSPFSKFSSWLKKRTSFRPKQTCLSKQTEITVPTGSRKTAVFVGISFLVLLGVSVFFGWKKRQALEETKQFETLYQEVDQKLSSAEAIKTMAPQDSLELAKDIKDKIPDLEKFNLEKDKLNRIRERTENLISFVGGIGKTKPELFFDLSLIADSAKGNGFYLDKNNLFVLDNINGKLMSIDVAKKSSKLVLTDEKLKNKTQVAAYSSKIYLFGKDGIDEVSDKNLKQVIGPDESLVNIKGIEAWLGNLYLLDAPKSAIWKYPVATAGFGKKQSWLRHELSQNGLSFSIDSDIWVLLENGKVNRFRSGADTGFKLNLTELPKKPVFISVALEKDRFCLFDDEEKAVWCFDKNGEFKGKTVLDLGSIQDMVLTDDKILLLSESKIFFLNYP